ncbi:hypothetical protein H3C65_01750 [Patescibacteria group bacterium]|nr:hypothetical protein [Patescibacteria group bacterium]
MDYSKAVEQLVTIEEAEELVKYLKELKDDRYRLITPSKNGIRSEMNRTGTDQDLLISKIKSLPTVKISLPFSVGRKTLERVSVWLKENLGKQVLIGVDKETNRDFKIEIFFEGKWREY